MGLSSIVKVKEDAYIQMFREHKATSLQKAQALSEMDGVDSAIFRRMLRKGVFAECEDNKYYLDRDDRQAFLDNRALIPIALLIVLAIFFLVIMLTE